MRVKLLHGRMAGEIQDLPYHAATALTASGQALDINAEGEAIAFPHQAMTSGSAVVPVESDAAGEVVVPPHAEAAKPKDEIATHATDGRPAEPRRAVPAKEDVKGKPSSTSHAHRQRGHR
jgi:hypothetical protein